MRTVRQGSERSLPPARQCVEVRVHAASVQLSAHMDSSTVECVEKSLATSLDSFYAYIVHGGSIETNFVDGIVLTHGSPRNHIWTFTAGLNQYATRLHGCPCHSDSYSGTIPPYVGNDSFCDSGRRYAREPTVSYLTNDPLWDGAGCFSGSCCTFNSPPWFCKNLSTPTTDDIELRLCINQVLSDEDVLFETVELYIQ